MTEYVNLDTGEIVGGEQEQEKPTLAQLVERAAGLKSQAISIAEDITELADKAKELYGTSKRDFNAFVKYTVLKDINADIADLTATKEALERITAEDSSGEAD